MEPILLEDWCYTVDMGCGGDYWLFGGRVIGHPHFHDGDAIKTSTPAHFDREKMQVRTVSGRLYQLGRCSGDTEKQISYILEDVERVKSKT